MPPRTRSLSPGTALMSSQSPNHHEEGSGAHALGTTARPPTKFVRGLRDLVDHYDTFLLDMWGVLHDGSHPYPGVLNALQELKRHNLHHPKRLVILSNSSKRRDHSVRMLLKLGFDPNDFEWIITSGEVAHQMLRRAASGSSKDDGKADAATTTISGENDDWLRYCEPWQPLARLSPSTLSASLPAPKTTQLRAFCLGSGDNDAEYLSSCGWDLAPVELAHLVVARGTFTVDDGTAPPVRKQSDPIHYESALRNGLERAAHRQLPMLVCNPDKVRPDADRNPMPGMLGAIYETLLAELVGPEEAERLVKRVGKPDRDVYDIALAGGDNTRGSRACMIGDALETDVAGGSAAGIDTVWVLRDGVHGPDVAECESLEDGARDVLEAFNQLPGTYAMGRVLTPTYAMPHFQW